MQTTLENYFDLERQAEIEVFIVDSQRRGELPGAQEQLPEQLFIMEQGGDMDIALYIDAAILLELKEDDPRNSLHRGNLENFCIALEGVSHFVLLIDRAGRGRKLSALELEIQAEVDKFLQASALLDSQGRLSGESRRWLERELFRNYDLRAGLSNEEKQRYVTATKVAHRFCKSISGMPQKSWRPEARRFFHRSLAEKVAA